MTCTAKRLAMVGVAGVAVMVGLAGRPAAASPARPAIIPRGIEAGYYGSDARTAQLRARIVVPRLICESARGSSGLTVSIGNQRQLAFGAIQLFCLRKGKPEYGVSVYAGNDGGVLVQLVAVKPGQRVVITVADREGRLTTDLSIDGHRPMRAGAKARPATFFDIGATIGGPGTTRFGPFRVSDATVNAGPLGSALTLIRTKQTEGERTVLTASPLRRGRAFTIRRS
jgi:hypothetical protein